MNPDEDIGPSHSPAESYIRAKTFPGIPAAAARNQENTTPSSAPFLSTTRYSTMKTLLRITLLATGVLAAAASSAFSADLATPAAPAVPQHPARAGQLARRAALRHHLAKRLGLTDAQKAQLKSDRASTAAALKSIRADASLTPDQKKAKVRETLQSARMQLRNVLTAEQQAKLQHLRARLHHRHARG